MVREEIIERFGITRTYGLHIITSLGGAALPSGVFGLRSGGFMASSYSFDLTVEGRGGHGAAPHLAVDPVVITAELVTTLQRIVVARPTRSSRLS